MQEDKSCARENLEEKRNIERIARRLFEQYDVPRPGVQLKIAASLMVTEQKRETATHLFAGTRIRMRFIQAAGIEGCVSGTQMWEGIEYGMALATDAPEALKPLQLLKKKRTACAWHRDDDQGIVAAGFEISRR